MVNQVTRKPGYHWWPGLQGCNPDHCKLSQIVTNVKTKKISFVVRLILFLTTSSRIWSPNWALKTSLALDKTNLWAPTSSVLSTLVPSTKNSSVTWKWTSGGRGGSEPKRLTQFFWNVSAISETILDRSFQLILISCPVISMFVCLFVKCFGNPHSSESGVVL